MWRTEGYRTTDELARAHQDLSLAFREFNQTSGVLERSYRELDTRVDALRAELAATRLEQRERNAEAERLTERFRRLLSVLPAGVIVLDGAGRVCESNAAARALIGVEIDGALWRDLAAEVFEVRPDDGPDLCLRGGRYVHLATCSLGAEPGQLLLLNDVTERRELESRVEKLRRLSAIGDMAATLAHQVRTPLASALLHVSGVRSRLALPGDTAREAAQASCARLTETLRRLERLVEDLLTFARRGHFEVEVFDLAEVLVAYREMHGPLADQRGGELALAIEPGRLPVAGNREALVSVLDNLIDNSVAVGGPATRVTLYAGAPENGQIVIRVLDDGPGIPRPARQRIFDPFYTNRAEGTGLGLAIARAVIESHGGSIDAIDPAAERGACLQIRLPQAEPGERL